MENDKVNNIYQTTFKYYIKNPFHKISIIRYEIKKLLKENSNTNFFEIINYKNKKNNIVKFKRPNFSYAIKVGINWQETSNNKKRLNRERKKREDYVKSNGEKYSDKSQFNAENYPSGLLELTIRTNEMLSNKQCKAIKKIITSSNNKVNGSTENWKYELKFQSKKQKIKVINNNKTNKIFEVKDFNYDYLIIKMKKIDKLISVNNQKIEKNCKIGEEIKIPRRRFYENQEIIDRNNVIITKENKNEKIKSTMDFHISLKSPIFCSKENITKQDLINQLINSICGQFKVSKDKIKFEIKNFENLKHGYVQFYKENKYKPLNNQNLDDNKINKFNDIKNPQTNNKHRYNLMRTKVQGIYGFTLKIECDKELMQKIVLRGLGGKSGLGMGYLEFEEGENYGK